MMSSRHPTAKRTPLTTRSPFPIRLPLATQQVLFDSHDAPNGDERHYVARGLEIVLLSDEGAV
jgi:hypothetical protein